MDNNEEHKALVRKITQESIVLLKNEQQLLPFDPDEAEIRGRNIGPYADQVALDWYSGTHLMQ